MSIAKCLTALSGVSLIGLATTGCYVEPSEPSTSVPESADDAALAVEIAAPPPTSSSFFAASTHACWIRWTHSVEGAREETISQYGCGPETSANEQRADANEERVDDVAVVSAARATCSEGSVAECELACSGGRLETCTALAQILRAGTRVPADPERADAILLDACERGRLDACLQRGVWLRETDAVEAAYYFAHACSSDDAGLTTTTACAEWMNFLDARAPEESPSDEVAGLSHVCTLEQTGKLVPGSTWTNGTLTVRYAGGACGRLKDLGMASARTGAARPAAGINAAAPRW